MDFDYNKESMDRLINYQNEISGSLPIPKIIIEPDGTCSLSWDGNRASLMISFPKDKIEYSYLGYNGEMDFGDIDNSPQESLDSLRKRAGVESFGNTRIFERKKY